MLYESESVRHLFALTHRGVLAGGKGIVPGGPQTKCGGAASPFLPLHKKTQAHGIFVKWLINRKMKIFRVSCFYNPPRSIDLQMVPKRPGWVLDLSLGIGVPLGV